MITCVYPRKISVSVDFKNPEIGTDDQYDQLLHYGQLSYSGSVFFDENGLTQIMFRPNHHLDLEPR